MAFQTILSPAELNKNLDNPTWAIMDCRFDLDDPEWGYQEYLAGHIPGSLYVNLDRDLSSQTHPRKNWQASTSG